MTSTCTICKLTLGPNDIKAHLNGKKHLRKLERFQKYGVASGSPQHGGKETQDSKEKPNTGDSKGDNKGKIINQKQVIQQNQPPIQGQRPKRKREEKKLVGKTEVPAVVIDKSKPFSEQLEDFLCQIQQCDVERQKIQWVLRDIAQTFSKIMLNVIPVLYGSQLSGLAFKTSDIDVYLCDPTGGEEDPEFIKRHGRAIYRTRLFTNVVHVTRARVPVLKAKHINTGIELDISATSGQAVANSLLLRFMLNYDSRIRKIMMLIGYWAKKTQLISTSKFSRYSFNLLVIFYLQNLEKPILPPLYKLVHGVPGKTWPFRINEDESLLVNDNDSPVHDLFMGFFEFYCNFPFTKYVISTYLGQCISVTDMESPEVLDRMVYYQLYISYGGEKLPQRVICIQDPLELSHNTSKAVLSKTLNQFVQLCKKMIAMKEKLKVDDWLHEIVSGEVAQPIFDKTKGNEFSLELSYKVQEHWIENFKKDFCQVLALLAINVGTDLPSSDESKKTKLNPNCLQLLIESSILPFNVECRRLVGLLKEGRITLEYFSKYFTPKLNSFGPNTFHFSALCLVTPTSKPGSLKLTFTNNGDGASFYTLLCKLRKSLQVFMNAQASPRLNPKVSTDKKDK